MEQKEVVLLYEVDVFAKIRERLMACRDVNEAMGDDVLYSLLLSLKAYREARAALKIAFTPKTPKPRVRARPYRLKGSSLNLSAHIDNCNLPVRINNILRAAGIVTIGDVIRALKMDNRYFLKLKNFGRKSFVDLLAFLATIGINENGDTIYDT